MEGFTIEKLNGPLMDELMYRVHFVAGPFRKAKDIAIPRFGFDDLSDRQKKEMIKLYLERAMREIMAGIADEAARHLDRYEQYNYDTTIDRRQESTATELVYRLTDFNYGDYYRQHQQENLQGLANEWMRNIYAESIFGRFVTPKDKSKNAPERKAMALLYRKIGKEKAQQIKKRGYFEVQGKHGTYRFLKDDFYGVSLVKNEKLGDKNIQVVYKLCLQSQEPDLPKGDVILSRYLAFIADEEEFLKTANLQGGNVKENS